MDAERIEPKTWYRLTLSDGESLKKELGNFVKNKGIDLAWVQVVGELEGGRIASGYEGTGDKIMNAVDDNRHILGAGTVRVAGEDAEPSVHLHGPAGRGEGTLTGCWADDPSVYRGATVLLVELQSGPR